MKKFKKIKNKVLIVDKNNTIDSVFREMALPSKTSVKLKGVAFITKEQKLKLLVADLLNLPEDWWEDRGKYDMDWEGNFKKAGII